MIKNKKISVVIPCKNEEKGIAAVIKNIPSYIDEIIVVDNGSTDRTGEVAKKAGARVIKEPRKMNGVGYGYAHITGIKNAKGDLLMIIGAHAVYPDNYIEKCVSDSIKLNADNVGGDVKPVVRINNIINNAIVLSFGGWFGKYDTEEKEKKPLGTDTVFGGCYKKDVFERIGLFNENLKRTSDLELNLRLKRSGGKIILIPNLIVYYYPSSNLKDFFLHNIEDGIWNILPLKFTYKPLRFRHYLPLIFILTIPFNIWIYLPIAFYFSAKIAVFKKNIIYFFIMPLVFLAKHIGHGIGSLWGVIKLIA